MQYGHFDNKSREYVIDRVDLPVSWTNYIGVGDMYGVFNHTAGGYLLYKSPEYHRVSARTACRWTAPGTISTSVTTRPATTGAFRGSRWGATWRNTRAATGSSYADGIIEHELHYEENGFQFFAADFEPDGFDCLRDDFIGAYRTERDPQSVVSGECRGRFENGGNHCGVLKKRLTLAPDEDARLIFMLGEGGRGTGRAMREKYTAARERGIKAMDSVDEYLYTDFGLMLNAPCYTKPDDGIGFVTRVYPGLKENGAIFSHPNPWAWCAEAVLGRGSRAMKFYNALCPALQNDKIEIRQSEPYSYCQFVVGRSHTAFGRARHPFMTGSAGWAYYAATQYILGVRPDFDCLRVDPCVPADWKEFSVTRKWRGGVYNIHVVNPDGVEKGVREIIADGRKVDAQPVIPAGNICNAEIIMG